MDKAKHTPGPWKAYPNGTICGGNYKGTQVCDTGWAFWSNRIHELIKSNPTDEDYDGNVVDFLRKNVETSTANARLIAAAPDLLRACHDALLAFVSINDGNFDLPMDVQQLIDYADLAVCEAIEKVEGGS